MKVFLDYYAVDFLNQISTISLNEKGKQFFIPFVFTATEQTGVFQLENILDKKHNITPTDFENMEYYIEHFFAQKLIKKINKSLNK